MDILIGIHLLCSLHEAEAVRCYEGPSSPLMSLWTFTTVRIPCSTGNGHNVAAANGNRIFERYDRYGVSNFAEVAGSRKAYSLKLSL
jgi:hypothetical protein